MDVGDIDVVADAGSLCLEGTVVVVLVLEVLMMGFGGLEARWEEVWLVFWVIEHFGFCGDVLRRYLSLHDGRHSD